MRYRQKSVEVEAVQVTHEFLAERCNDPNKHFELYTMTDGERRAIDYFASGVGVSSRTGHDFAHIGDYIVTMPDGERVVVPKNSFEARHEVFHPLQWGVLVELRIRTPELDEQGLQMGATRQITMGRNDPDLLSSVARHELLEGAAWLAERFRQYAHGEIRPGMPESEVPLVQKQESTIFERMLAALKRGEWVEDSDEDHRCLSCDAFKEDGHRDFCHLHALIQEAEEASKR